MRFESCNHFDCYECVNLAVRTVLLLDTPKISF